MKNKIKIIIADDNKYYCNLLDKFLRKFGDIEVLGIALNDEEEVKLIEELNPEIVVTDLMRNYKYTGVDIIKKYYNKDNAPEFLVVSADVKSEVINNGLKVAGYLQKPCNYERIYEELKRIKKEARSPEYKKWAENYYNKEMYNINEILDKDDIKILSKLGIVLFNKIYTEHELEVLKLKLLEYYNDPEEDLSEEEKQYQKSLKKTNVSQRQYNDVLQKIEKLMEKI